MGGKSNKWVGRVSIAWALIGCCYEQSSLRLGPSQLSTGREQQNPATRTYRPRRPLALGTTQQKFKENSRTTAPSYFRSGLRQHGRQRTKKTLNKGWSPSKDG